MLDMQQYAWSHRPVLVFAGEGSDPLLRRQRELLGEASGALADREVVLVEVVGDAVRVNGEPVHDGGARGLRQRYDIETPDAFAVVLVGKDTGVKLRSDEPVPAVQLIKLIDGMPMRRQESRRRDARAAD